MQLIAPDILAEARGLTEAMSGTLCVLGMALWLFGWRWHRFWIVAGVTLGAGLCGLHAGRAVGGAQILAVGVLLSVAAGMMALELARIFAFVAAGCAAWLAALWVFPQAQELWAVFLSGGLFGLILYRVWTMLLTSLGGVLVAGHAALLLLEPLLEFDAVEWVAANQAAVNGSAIALAILGIVLQAVFTRGSRGEAEQKHEKHEKPKEKAEHKEKPPEVKSEDKHAHEPKPEAKPSHSDPWWQKLVSFRKVA
ncbi:MAG: hypothetical protein K8U57_12695 [Planctomycetes bacterium]|nr:hypothetical protein [Planctomycetota bacterium]